MLSLKLLAVLIFGLTLLQEGGCLSNDVVNQIKEMAEAIMACRNIVGMNLAIVQNGETVLTDGYGVIDRDTNDPVTPRTVFPVASVTKQFTATTLALVLEENGLNWNTKVRDVLGEDFYFPDGLRTSQATMKDLAAHRLGMSRSDFIAWSDNYTRQDEVLGQRFLETVEDFRDQVLYNNNMYNMIGYITEVLTGESWEDVVTKRLFEPANMTSSTFVHKLDGTEPDFAKPYFIGGIVEPLRRVNKDVARIGTRAGGGGSMATTAEDMLQWMKLQLNKGTLNGVTIVPEHIIEKTRTGANLWTMTDLMDSFNKPTVPATYVLPEYALGLKNGWYRDYRMISHSGDIIGYHSLLSLLPDMDVGLFSAVNGADVTSLGRRLFHSYVMDLVLGLDPWLNTTTACTFPEPWDQQLDESEIMATLAEGVDMLSFVPEPASGYDENYPQDLEVYTGEFGNFYYGNLTIYINDSTSRLMLAYGVADPWDLIPIGENNFFFGVASDRMWPVHIEGVTFTKSDNDLEYFDIIAAQFPRSGLAIFVHGLKMSDAPPPPNPNACT